MSFFSAVRPINDILLPGGVENVKIKHLYTMADDPAKYMVHLNAQQLYAEKEGDEQKVANVKAWFERFENALRIFMYDKEGVVLIDELETYLHLEMQKNVLPSLTIFFHDYNLLLVRILRLF